MSRYAMSGRRIDANRRNGAVPPERALASASRRAGFILHTGSDAPMAQSA